MSQKKFTSLPREELGGFSYLKKEFPQLDPLNITFPLSDFQKLFPYFFEQNTLPDQVRIADPLRNEPVDIQMKDQYKRINAN